MRYAIVILLIIGLASPGACAQMQIEPPIKIIFDTDIGDDIDDALALAMLHALADRSEVEILAVTVCKDNPWCAVYVDIVNRFYGRPDIPIGVVKGGKRPQDGYTTVVASRKIGNEYAYARGLQSGENAPDAVDLIRSILARQADSSVVMVSVGSKTNIARLLQSKPDKNSSANGIDLVKSKVKNYVMMAGDFRAKAAAEYNIKIDADAARIVFEDWPTSIAISGFDIGKMVYYPAESIEQDFGYVKNHPIAEAYHAYAKMPYDRPAWDLTAVLYAARPERGYFKLSQPGYVKVDDKAVTHFTAAQDGRHRYFILPDDKREAVREACIWLASSPPRNCSTQ